MKVIIPLAGKGTRLRPHTHLTTPSQCYGSPANLSCPTSSTTCGASRTYEEVIYVTGHLKDKVEAYVREAFKVPSVFIEQPAAEWHCRCRRSGSTPTLLSRS